MSKTWISVAVVMVLASALTAVAAATLKASPKVDAARSHLEAARTLIEQSMADEPPNDYAKTTAAQNADRLARIKSLEAVLAGDINAAIAEAQRISPQTRRPDQIVDLARLALLLDDPDLADRILGRLSTVQGLGTVPSLGELDNVLTEVRSRAAAATAPAAPVDRLGPMLDALTGRPRGGRAAGSGRRSSGRSGGGGTGDPDGAAVEQAVAANDWATLATMADAREPARRALIRHIECFARLKQGDIAGAESAARLAIEAACGGGRADDVCNAARDIAAAFYDAGHRDAARRVCTRAVRLASVAHESTSAYGAFSKLAVDQHRRGDLAYAVAWTNDLASPFISQPVRIMLGETLLLDVLEALGTSLVSIAPPANLAAVAFSSDGTFEGKSLGFWLDLASKPPPHMRPQGQQQQQQGKQQYERSVETALVAIGKPAIPAMVEMLKAGAASPGGGPIQPNQFAVNVLWKIGPDAAVPVTEVLRTNAKERNGANEVLQRIGVAAIDPLVLAASAPDADPGARMHVAIVLTILAERARGEHAAKLAGALQKLAADPDDKVRQAALPGVGKLAKLQPAASPATAPPGAVASAPSPAPAGSPLAPLIASLTDPSDNIRRQAALILEQASIPELTPLLPALINALEDDKSRDVRGLIARVIGKLGAAAAPATPALTNWKKLKGGDEDVANALGKIGPSATAVLIQQLNDADNEVRWAALRALRKTDPATVQAMMPQFMQLVADPEFAHVALQCIGQLKSAAAPQVLQLLNSPDPILRAHGLSLAGYMYDEPGRGQVQDALIALLIANPNQLDEIAHAFSSLESWPKLVARVESGQDAEPVRVLLIEAIGRQRFNNPRDVAAFFIELWQPTTPSALRAAGVRGFMFNVLSEPVTSPNLRPFTDADPAVRLAALRVARGDGFRAGDFHLPSQFVPFLVKAAADPDVPTALTAVQALIRAGMHREAGAHLARLLGVADEATRVELLDVLGGANADAAGAISKCLADPSRNVRMRATAALGRVAVSGNAVQLGDADPEVRLAAARAMAQAARVNPAARQALVTAASSSRDAAVVAASKLPPPSGAPRAGAEHPLLQYLAAQTDPAARVRAFAAVMGIFEENSYSAEPLAARAIRDPAPQVRIVGAEAMAAAGKPSYGSKPDAVRDSLYAMLDDADPAVRLAAMRVFASHPQSYHVIPHVKRAMLRHRGADEAFRLLAARVILDASTRLFA